MPETLPSVAVIAELESRQDQALRKLTELEQQVERALVEFTAVSKRAANLQVGEPAGPATIKFPTPSEPSVPAVKVA